MSETETQPNQREIIRTQFEELLDLPDDQFDEAAQAFIDSRLQQLEATSDSTIEEINYHTGNYKGFISDGVQIRPNLRGRSFLLDDPEMYQKLPQLMKHYYQKFSEIIGDDPEKAYTNAAFYAVQKAQSMYFYAEGSNPYSAQGKNRRENLLSYSMDDEPEGTKLPSIADFKGVAQCSERATVANNMLHVLGVEPVLVAGALETGSENKEFHHYLIIQTSSGREAIFDPTNPIIRQDSYDALLSVEPALYPVEPTFLDQVESRVAVEYIIYIEDEDGSIQTDSSKYIYENSQKASDYHPT
jgi:hypothetical protein